MLIKNIRSHSGLALYFILSLIPVWCIANNTSIQNDFLNYEKKINQKKINSTKDIPNKLKQYSLYPYLEFALLQKKLGQDPKNEIKEFYAKYSSEPVAKKLNYDLIKHLAVRGKWQDILEYYQDNSSTNLRCLLLEARQHVAPQLISSQDIRDIWLYGKSRPKECDTLFKLWLDHGVLNKALIWERIYLAIEQNQSDLVTYLGKYLFDKDNEDIKLWARVNRDVNLIHRTQLFDTNNLFHHKIIIHGLEKIARKNIDESLAYYRNLNLLFKFRDKEKYNYYKYLAIRMYLKDHKLTENILNEIPLSYYDEQLHGIAIKNALKNGDWHSIIKRINKLPLEERKKDIWIYWQARAFDELKKPNLAKSLFKSIAHKTNYYGLMACDNLKQFCPIEFTITKPFQADKNKLLNNAGIKRAIELYNLKRFNDARLEWNHVVKQLDEKHKLIAASIADELNWHDRTIVTVALYDKQKSENNVPTSTTNNNSMSHLKYPLGYRNLVFQFAKKYNLDPAWIFAISRQESSFVNDAKSSAGALGVMQLMPATAREVAKDAKIPYYSKWNLLKEQTNIRLGTAYLQQILENLDGNPVLATAAYNAGPTRVKEWTEKYKSVPTDVWIELVPYTETRNYLKTVVTNTAIYRSRLGNPPSQLSDIFPVNIEPKSEGQ